MDLEKKINNKPGFFKRISRKVIPYVFAVSVGLAGLAIAGCKEEPGPIYVQNTVSPTSIPSGGNVYWEVEVTNNGGEVTIERVRARERVISGWAEGEEASGDLPITNNKISPYSTETIFSASAQVWNIPPYGTPPNMFDIAIENTVTVSSDGGEDSDTCTYIIRSIYSSSNLQPESKKESSKVDSGVLRVLSDYLNK